MICFLQLVLVWINLYQLINFVYLFGILIVTIGVYYSFLTGFIIWFSIVSLDLLLDCLIILCDNKYNSSASDVRLFW